MTGGRPGRHRNPLLHPGHPPEARHLLATTRTHWMIGNGLHWVLDVAFREDESWVRTGHAPRAIWACCGRIRLPRPGWPSGVARPAATSPTWSKSWAWLNLAIALGLYR